MTLDTDKISLSYFDGDQMTFAVRDITISIPQTGIYGIMGPSGSGKSSLLYLMSGLKRPTSGSIQYDGRSLSEMPEYERVRIRRERFGFVFQQPFLLNYLTARENVLIAASKSARDSGPQVDALLEDLNIAHLGKRFPAHLSGCERQRIIVARAMINRPEIIFADEPTAALDHGNGRAVIELLMRYREQGTVLIVSHDPTMLSDADRIFHLSDGNLDHIEERTKSKVAETATRAEPG